MIDRPGIYRLSDDQYFTDPCPEPSLSSTIAKIILNQSPYHAWFAHPRLNPRFEPYQDDKFNLGKAAHDFMLQGGRAIEVVDANDWRKKENQIAKEVILSSGKIPLLKHQFYQVEDMARAAEEQLAVTDARDAYTNGDAEQSIIWQEPCGVWCRAKMDWVTAFSDGQPKFIDIFDHKTTAGSAHPNAFARQLFGLGYDIQAAFYIRGVKALFPAADVRFRFTPQEVEPPYCLSVVELPPAVLSMAERKVEAAIAIWDRCLKENRWPAYPSRTVFIDIPGWAEKQGIDRENDEMAAADSGIDLFEVGMTMSK